MPPKRSKVTKPAKKTYEYDMVRMAEIEEAIDENTPPFEAPHSLHEYVMKMHEDEYDDILPENRWNMDEVGYQRQKSYITCYESVSALGQVIKPLVVFKNEKIEDDWIKENMGKDAEEYQFFFNNVEKLNTKKLLMKWFTESFLPQTKPKNPDDWRLIVWDDISLHASYEQVGQLCKQHKIKLLSVPAEVAHYCQPLEATLVPRIKKILSDKYQETEIAENEGYGHRFLKMIHAARKEVMTEKMVKFAWYDTGLFPPNSTQIYARGEQIKPKGPRSQWVICRRE